MNYKSNSIEEYIDQVPVERKEVLNQLRATISKNLPDGFEEGLQYGMPAFYVPHTIYPDGYHCKPAEPLPFLSYASQKNSINLYHMGLYASPDIYKWFVAEYPKHSTYKLDMGKSCIRFKKINDIPYDLIAALCQKMTIQQWIETYEETIKK